MDHTIPKVSVVVPAYNVEGYIAETIQSVLNQTYPDFELLIINDGSSDHTQNVIDGFTDSRISVFRQTNQGVSAARNVGIDNAKGEFICFLDGDDIYEPDFLKLMVTNISGNIIYCGYYSFWGKFCNKEKTEHYAQKYISGKVLYEELFNIVSICMINTLIRRDALIESGIKFTPECTFSEDNEFHVKLLCIYQSDCVSQELVGYRRDRFNSARNTKDSYNKKINEIAAQKRILEFVKHNYHGEKCNEILSKIKSNLDYSLYRAILIAIREKRYEEAQKLLDENNTIDLKRRSFRQILKWRLMSTRNRLIWKFL